MRLVRPMLLGGAALLACGAAPALPTIRDDADAPAMVVLPPGRFAIGSSDVERRYFGVPDEIGRREAPRHPVRIAHGFAIARTEVTVAQYARFVTATRRGDDAAPSSWPARSVASASFA